MFLRFRSLLLMATLVAVSGCLPYSCNRTEKRALTPADSLSRQYAETLPVDTLRLVWRSGGPEDAPMAYPRTVHLDEADQVHVVDPKQQRLYTFAPDGTPTTTVALAEDAEFPFLIGQRDDTLFVFSPDQQRIDAYFGGTRLRSLPTPEDVPERGTLQYAAVSDSAFFVKVLGEDFSGFVARLDDGGMETARLPLPGPPWRYAGFMRVWGDTLLSLAGYRPLLDLWPLDTLHATPQVAPDSLRLYGFDSPMLARMRLFMTGEEHLAPLLSASADPAGDLLFMLNMRPGWLRIDAFDRSGQLRHRLVQENPGFNMEYFPQDLAVREVSPGSYVIAVVTTEPAPEVQFYRWQLPE